MKRIIFLLFIAGTIAISFSSCNLPVPTGEYLDAYIDGNYVSCSNLSCIYDEGNNQIVISGTTVDGDDWAIGFYLPTSGSGEVSISPADNLTYIRMEKDGVIYEAKEDIGSGTITVTESGTEVGDIVSGEFEGTLVNSDGISISVTSGEFSIAIGSKINFKKK